MIDRMIVAEAIDNARPIDGETLFQARSRTAIVVVLRELQRERLAEFRQGAIITCFELDRWLKAMETENA